MAKVVHSSTDAEGWLEEVAVQHLRGTRNWHRDQFRLQRQGQSPDQRCAIVWAIFLEDETCPIPGAGQSLELYIDRLTRHVVKELGFQ